jgi:UDP-3-O-[3-hydroxymyristoyl] glucosamine N-acyltransferase
MIDYRIDRKASVAPGVILGAFAVIREYADIAVGAQIGAGVYIGPYVKVGENADIGPHAVILANVPAGAVVPPNVVWDAESAQASAVVMFDDGRTHRPRKAVRA